MCSSRAKLVQSIPGRKLHIGYESEELPKLRQAHTLVRRSAVMWNRLSGPVSTAHVMFRLREVPTERPNLRFTEGLLRSSRCPRFPCD